MKGKIPAWMGTAAGMLVLTAFAVGALIPGADRDAIKGVLVDHPVGIEPIAHFAFPALACFLFLSRWPPLWWLRVSVVILACGMIELGQLGVAGRHASLAGFGLDIAGAVVGTALAFAWSWLRKAPGQ